MNWLKYKVTAPGTRLLVAGGLCLSLFFNASAPALSQSLTDEGTVLAYLIEMYRRTGRDCQEARQPNMPELVASDQLKQALQAVEGGKDVKTAISEQGLVSNANAIFTVTGETARQAFSTLKDQNCAGLLGNYNQIAAINSGGRWTVLLADARPAPVNTEPGMPGPDPAQIPAQMPGQIPGQLPGQSLSPEQNSAQGAPEGITPGAAVNASPTQSATSSVAPAPVPGVIPGEVVGATPEPRKIPAGLSASEMEAATPDASVNWRVKGEHAESRGSSSKAALNDSANTNPRPVTVPPGTKDTPYVAPATSGSGGFSSAATPNPALGSSGAVSDSFTPAGTVYEGKDGSRIIVTNQNPAQPLAAAGAQSKPQGQPVTLSGEAQLAFEMINQARASGRQCGSKKMPAVPRLTLDPALTRAAQKHAQDMAKSNYFAQKSPSGKQADQRISDEGFMWVSIGENIARGHATAQPLVQSWLAAPRNCENIMSGSFDKAGLAFDPASQIWVLDLAKALQ